MHLQHPRAFKSAICAAILAMTFAGSAIADEDEAPSKGNESASAMTSKFVSDEIGAAASRRSVTASA